MVCDSTIVAGQSAGRAAASTTAAAIGMTLLLQFFPSLGFVANLGFIVVVRTGFARTILAFARMMLPGVTYRRRLGYI